MNRFNFECKSCGKIGSADTRAYFSWAGWRDGLCAECSPVDTEVALLIEKLHAALGYSHTMTWDQLFDLAQTQGIALCNSVARVWVEYLASGIKTRYYRYDTPQELFAIQLWLVARSFGYKGIGFEHKETEQWAS